MELRGIKPGGREPVVVALSGGVDSSVCAGLLVEAGYPVVGVSMRLYDAGGTKASSGGRCCGPRDLEDARALCAYLGIPFYVANYEETFRETVIHNFIQTYREGKTPNPCARCNQYIKFTPLLQMTQALGGVALCTGHYARLEPGADGWMLRRGVDPKKDQSYFLFSMPKDQLEFIQFPLGTMTKTEVRAHAARLRLPTADKPESQEICFVPDGNHAGFVAAQAGGTEGGEIVDSAERVVGTHEGVHAFTIGQRRGIGVGLGEKQYVVQIDALTRKVKVGSREALARDVAWVEEVSWFGPPPAAGEVLSAEVQIRHRHPAAAAQLTVGEHGNVQVRFAVPELAVSPGQAAVFYRGDTVLGGGFLSAVESQGR